ncbi:MAG: TonB-dependent receptor [Chitinophagaceae bacterium]
MKKNIFLCISIFSFLISYGQNSLKAIIRDSSNYEILAGASAITDSAGKGNIANKKGFVQINNIPDGRHRIIFSYSGYEPRTEVFNFPIAYHDTITILLVPGPETLNEVIVQSTRTSRRIANTPTRVETIDGEELDEKNNMRPSNVSMLLHESTGLQVQQTSSTSGNASIRVQGLDGKYTQLLKDGYPNFGAFASGLSILEIPPLDLAQIEVIKGPASTLFGGGAIAGVINFISKMPGDKPRYDFIINHSNVGQTNVGVYASGKRKRFGYAMLALVNFQKAYDVDKDEFSDLPKNNNFTIHPRFFYYPDNKTTIMLGNSFTKGNNRGGDMFALNGKTDSNHVYFEDNHTIRNTTSFEAERKYQNRSSIKIRESFSIFYRKINIPGYVFSGLGTNSFTDISYLFNKSNHTIITGTNFIFDRFTQKSFPYNQDTKSFTTGFYIQDTWDISEKIKIETGVRADNINYTYISYNKNQIFILPRVAVLFKISDKLSSRIGGGLGYKIPTIFTEQTEAMQYQDILPLNNVAAEKSTGGTMDINYKTQIGDALFFSLNQLFFYTQINKPLVLEKNSTTGYFFTNAAKPVTSRGFETNLKFIFRKDFKLFAGYTYTSAKATYAAGNQHLVLLPKDKLNLSLVYEKEEKFKIGLEGYLTGNQYLYNNLQTPSFWEFGIMAEKTIRKISLFINFENFTDQRQSKYKSVVNPPHNNPSFDDIWNHTEGFIFNGGVKIKL